MARTKPRRSAGPRPQRTPSRPTQFRRLGTAVLLVAVAVVAAWIWSTRRPRTPEPAAVNPAAALDARAAFLEGGRLGTAGRHVESIPYFRRALTDMGGMWEGRINLAAALINAGLEVETRLGRVDPALRSSYERVQSVREGIGEARQAMPVARDARARAYTAYQDAQLLQSWGFQWDALVAARAAQSFDPGWELPKRLALDLQRDLARGGTTP